MKDFEKLLLERRRKHLVAYKVAAAANIDPTTYSRIENGRMIPTDDQKQAIEKALGVEAETIFERGK